MSTMHPLHGFFITGTDTEIGKTCITAGLTRALDGLGRYVTPIKSLAAGQTQNADGVWVNEDVAQLHAAQTQGMTMDEVGPLQFREPCVCAACNWATSSLTQTPSAFCVWPAARDLIGVT